MHLLDTRSETGCENYDKKNVVAAQVRMRHLGRRSHCVLRSLAVHVPSLNKNVAFATDGEV